MRRTPWAKLKSHARGHLAPATFMVVLARPQASKLTVLRLGGGGGGGGGRWVQTLLRI